MDRQKIIMVAALVGWGLFAGTQITKTLLLGKLECPKCDCLKIETTAEAKK